MELLSTRSGSNIFGPDLDLEILLKLAEIFLESDFMVKKQSITLVFCTGWKKKKKAVICGFSTRKKIVSEE